MPDKRERIDREDGDRFVRRDDAGQFTEDQENVGRSISQDRKRDAENAAEKGERDRGDSEESINSRR